MKKILLIIIDGLSDRPIPQLKNKTPLEAAKTPNLDWLAKNGLCGKILPFQFPWQKVPESDTCHLALFGYDPKLYYLGRGPYEAAGIGLKMKEEDVALRVNFATVNKNLKVIDRRAGRIEKTQPLIKSLSGARIKGVRFLMKKSVGHRAVLVLRGKNLSKAITDGDPRLVEEKVRKIFPKDKTKESRFTAEVLNKFLINAHWILKDHPFNKERKDKKLPPANYLLVRGAGKFKKTPSLYLKYGLKAACLASPESLYRGIAKILGMKLIKVREKDTSPISNPKWKILPIKKIIKKYDFIFCHIKTADSLAEDGNFFGKKEFIEKIDKNLKTLLNLKNTLIVVTADHSTCSLLKRHCPEPIPILIYGKDKDLVKQFSEKACRKGKLGRFKQLDLMSKILALYRK